VSIGSLFLLEFSINFIAEKDCIPIKGRVQSNPFKPYHRPNPHNLANTDQNFEFHRQMIYVFAFPCISFPSHMTASYSGLAAEKDNISLNTKWVLVVPTKGTRPSRPKIDRKCKSKTMQCKCTRGLLESIVRHIPRYTPWNNRNACDGFRPHQSQSRFEGDVLFRAPTEQREAPRERESNRESARGPADRSVCGVHVYF
jgi:hypothetical protein